MICPAKSAQELLAEFRTTGRQEPFEEIVRRYAAMVFHICFQVLKNRHDAEDATQAVFLTLAVQGKTNKEIRSIGPWLQQVAKRLSLDLRKARKRRAAREQQHGVSNSNGGNGLALASGVAGQELRHILSEELNQLAPKYRLPLILHYFGGLSRQQMSQELGCKEATLGVRLHRGREMLAARLSQRGVMLSAAGLGLFLSYMVREAVAENLVWSTSHVASQMVAGHPIGSGLVSARAMALARAAGNTMAVAKIKAIVASVLIAATAVAAGEVVSRVRPTDLKIQSPAGDRIRDLLRPKLPDLRSEVSPPATSPPAQELIVKKAVTIESDIPQSVFSAGRFMPAGGAEWGGSILSAQWIGSATTTHIPGIIWASPGPISGGGISHVQRAGYAVGPVAAPIARPNEQRISPFMARPGIGAKGEAAPYVTVPQKTPKRPAQEQTVPQQFQIQLAPSGELPPPMEIIASAPKLFLEASTIDERIHPAPPAPPNVVLAGVDLVAQALGHNGVLVQADSAGQVNILTISGFSNHTSHQVTVTHPVVKQPHLHPTPPLPEEPGPTAMQVSSAFGDAATIRFARGSIKGYGEANRASEFTQNGQVIADGDGQERTLDLSLIGVIRNSLDNARGGHNGWFAQNKGKLVLPSVAFNDGQATWGEDEADPQLDLINSVRISVDPSIVGSIKLSLLSADRSDYPALPAHFDAVGLWQMDAIDVVLGSVDLTVRYDVDLANDLRLSSGLNLWGYDGNWKPADTISISSIDRLISARLGNIDYFAVVGSTRDPIHTTGTPEPAAMLGLACAGLLLSRRRRR